jgi:hypothetical protein
MNNRLALILSIAMMLMVSFAIAQDYTESDEGCAPEADEEAGVAGIGIECTPSYHCFTATFPWTTKPDIIGWPGKTITFTGKDSAATYYWTVRDGYGSILKQGPGSTFTFTLPLKCGVGYTVEWTATVPHGTDLACINKGCITIWVPCICIRCPDFPDYCVGTSPATYPTLKVPPPYTVIWSIDGVAAGMGDAPTGWDALPVGKHTIVGKVYLGKVRVKTCTDTLEVFPTPTGGAGWS